MKHFHLVLKIIVESIQLLNIILQRLIIKKHILFINLSSNDNDVTSIQHKQENQSTNARVPSSSSSMDIRASDVIKRITSPRSTISDGDEILPQTFLHRMSTNFNMNSLVQTTSTSSSVRQTIHNINSTDTNNDNYNSVSGNNNNNNKFKY